MGKGVNCEYLQQIENARRDLDDLLSSNKQMAPLILRLAFHDAATYDRKTHTGGANGSIRNELNNPPNKGMDAAVKFLEPVKRRHLMVTYADLYQLAGITAVRVTGGPIIEFVPGRKDALNQRDSGSIPNPRGDAAHLRSIFVNQMGLTDKDIVVLSGAHALGRAHKDRTPGFDGPFTRDPLTFDNSYYIELLRGDTPGLVKFPTDKALLSDKVFRRLVEIYARDEEAFFRDYAISHKKLSELGFNPNMIHGEAHHNVPHYQAQGHHHHHGHHHQAQHHYGHQAQHHYSEPMHCYGQGVPSHCYGQPQEGPYCEAQAYCGQPQYNSHCYN